MISSTMASLPTSLPVPAERLDEELVSIHSSLNTLSHLLKLFSFQDPGITSPTPSTPDSDSSDKPQENGNLPCEPNHNHIVQVRLTLHNHYHNLIHFNPSSIQQLLSLIVHFCPHLYDTRMFQNLLFILVGDVFKVSL